MDILIVEDDFMLNTVMTLQLKMAGLLVRSAENGLQALRMISELVPAVLILDFGLPDMTGLEVVAMLRQKPETCSIPLIVHTTVDLTSEQRSEFTLGPTRCVTKSTACSDRLAELIIELVEEKRNGRS